jgi:hypothetical protein
MTFRIHRQTEITISRGGVVGRREFLKGVSLAGAAAGALSWCDWMTAHADELRQQKRACILLWMQGGPSQLETFDPKPGHENGGETRGIQSAVPGIAISENLPRLAKSMNDLCVLRSVNSREGNHPRATYLMHTGYLPTASIKHPSIGALAAHELANPQFDLPAFVRVGEGNNRGSAGGGFLGVSYDPFVVQDASRAPNNTTVFVPEARFRRRLNLLAELETEYENRGGKQEVGDHRQLYDKASKLVLSPKMNTFDLSGEPQHVRELYGSSPFGNGCLLARRLVEAGVTFVEVNLGNWDTHDNNAERTKTLCETMDQPFAALVHDLQERGMLQNTLVVWMGEFGRTPRINPRGGRDHYPKAFNAVLAGGGVKGGQVIGATSANGEEVKDRPIGVTDLLRTICHSLKIDADKENVSNVGRPLKVVDGGEVVEEVFG